MRESRQEKQLLIKKRIFRQNKGYLDVKMSLKHNNLKNTYILIKQIF